MNAKRLRAAYYARYSTDGQEADSIDRQFMVCDTIAKREGFLHAEHHPRSGARVAAQRYGSAAC